MGKRSNFTRRDLDYYPTPVSAVKPLIDYLKPDRALFVEPCTGDGSLIRHLEVAGSQCVYASDVNPMTLGYGIRPHSWDKTPWRDVPPFDYIITNPPWSRDVLHPMIQGLSEQGPTWLLFDADWMHTAQAAPYIKRLRVILSVGRVKWIPDSPYTGKDNCCWYLFDKVPYESSWPVFIGRNCL